MFAAQIYDGIELRLAPDELQAEIFCDRCYVYQHFGPRKRLANTASWASRKRQHRKGVSALRTLRSKTIGIEAIRILPQLGIPLDEVERYIDLGCRWHEKLA